MYDPLLKTWKFVKALQIKKCGLSVVILEGKIYVFGGYNLTDSYLSSVEAYHPQQDKWLQCQSMLRPKAFCGVVVLENRVYICGGGSDDVDETNTVKCYCPKMEKWEWLIVVIIALSSHKMACYMYLGVAITV